MYMPLFAKNLYFDIIMYVFLSFFHIYAVLFKPLLKLLSFPKFSRQFFV